MRTILSNLEDPRFPDPGAWHLTTSMAYPAAAAVTVPVLLLLLHTCMANTNAESGHFTVPTPQPGLVEREAATEAPYYPKTGTDRTRASGHVVGAHDTVVHIPGTTVVHAVSPWFRSKRNRLPLDINHLRTRVITMSTSSSRELQLYNKVST